MSGNRQRPGNHRRRDPLIAQRVTTRLSTLVPGLSETGAWEAMQAARVTAPVSLWMLEEHLAAHGIAPSARGPLQLIRLFKVLDAGGYSVPPTACAQCERQTRSLPHLGDDGRVCDPCRHLRYVRQCEICGETKRIWCSGATTGVCERCRRRNPDPDSIGPCEQCGRVKRLIARKGDGVLRCTRCQQTRTHICVECGADAQAQKFTEAGPVCRSCYRQRHQPQRVCGRCGRLRRIGQRATSDRPDLCTGCYRGVEGSCSRCGRFRHGRKTGNSGFLCQGCLPRPLRECVQCHRRRTVQAIWPMGPVCSSCYRIVRQQPATCPICHQTRVLTAIDADGARTCGPCAGARDYACAFCARPGFTYADQRCAWCVLDERATDLLTGADGLVAASLQPLRAALTDTDRPDSVLGWIGKPHTCKLLAWLAANPSKLSHELFDELPAVQHIHYLRALLVLAGVLPPRDEYLERTKTWLDRALTELPAGHRQFIRPFAQWNVLHRSRRRSQHLGPRTAGSAAKDRKYIMAATGFLAWLDEHGLTLASINQQDLDQWLDTRPAARHLRPFIKWTNQRGLTTALDVPGRPNGLPNRFLTEEQRWTQLRQCLDDAAIPTKVRVAGLLVLLFGVTLARIANLTTDDVTVGDDGAVAVTFGKQPIALPPRVAAVVAQLVNERERPSAIRPTEQTKLIYPGRPPSRPINLQTLSRTLIQHGITAHLGRNAAMLDLAADLPAVVLADLLGINPSTTAKWNSITSRDWTHYLEARTEPP